LQFRILHWITIVPNIVTCRFPSSSVVSSCLESLRITSLHVAVPRVILHHRRLSLPCVAVVSPHLVVACSSCLLARLAIQPLSCASHARSSHTVTSLPSYTVVPLPLSSHCAPHRRLLLSLKVRALPIESFWIGMLVLVLQICFIKIIPFFIFIFHFEHGWIEKNIILKL